MAEVLCQLLPRSREGIMEGLDQLLQRSRMGIHDLYSLIGYNPKVLDVDKDALFVDTPLHKAVSSGHREVAMEIFRMMPSYGRKLNPQGHSPLHIAIGKGYVDLVRYMIKLDPELIRVQGREGITPLHSVAEKDQVDLLAEFLLRRPDSIWDLTIHGETAVHVAVKQGKLEASKVLIGWLRWKRMTEVLELRDWDGHNVMRLAETSTNPQVRKLLDPTPQVSVHDKPTQSESSESYTMKCTGRPMRKKSQDSSHSNNGTLARYFSSTSKYDFGLMRHIKIEGEIRNAMLVVAVLIATATFQAVLSPPGGFTDHNPITNSNTSTTVSGNATIFVTENNHGRLMMSRSDYRNFAPVNSIAFSLSLAVILMAVPLRWSSGFLYLSVIFFSVTYILAIKISSQDRTVITIIAVLLPYIIFGCVLCWPHSREIDETRLRRIAEDTHYDDRKGGDVAHEVSVVAE